LDHIRGQSARRILPLSASQCGGHPVVVRPKAYIEHVALAASIETGWYKKGELTMAMQETVDWDALIRDPRFQRLHRRKTLFLWGLMALSVVYYFLLPIGAAYYQDMLRIRAWGVINVGLLFALSEFAVAWAIALYYSRRAGREFDQLAAEIAADFVVQNRN